MEIYSQIIGWAGALLVVLAYFLISYKKIASTSKLYQILNLVGAICVGINAYYQEAFPSFFIQIVWGIIAVTSLIKISKK